MGSESRTPASVRVLAVATAILLVCGVALTQVIPREDEGNFVYVPPGAYVPPTSSTTARDASGPLATVGGSTTTAKGKTTTAGSSASGGPAPVAGEPRPTATTAV